MPASLLLPSARHQQSVRQLSWDNAEVDHKKHASVLPHLGHAKAGSGGNVILEERVNRMLSNKRISELYLSWMPWQQKALLAGVIERCSTDQLATIYKAVEPISHGSGVAGNVASSPFARSAQLQRAKQLSRELSYAIEAVFHRRKAWKSMFAKEKRRKIISARQHASEARSDMYRYIDPAMFSSDIEKALQKILCKLGIPFISRNQEKPSMLLSSKMATGWPVNAENPLSSKVITEDQSDLDTVSSSPDEEASRVDSVQSSAMEMHAGIINLETFEVTCIPSDALIQSGESGRVDDDELPSIAATNEEQPLASMHDETSVSRKEEQSAIVQGEKSASLAAADRDNDLAGLTNKEQIAAADVTQDAMVHRFSIEIMQALSSHDGTAVEKIPEIVAETILSTAANMGLYDPQTNRLSMSPSSCMQLKERLSGEVIVSVLRHHQMALIQKQQTRHSEGERNTELRQRPPASVEKEKDASVRRLPQQQQAGSRLQRLVRTRRKQTASYTLVPSASPAMSTDNLSQRSMVTRDYFPDRPLQKLGSLCRGVASLSGGSSVDAAIPIQMAYKSVKFSQGINEEFLVRPNRKKLAGVYHSQLQDIWQAVEQWRPNEVMMLIVDLVKISADDILASLKALLASKCRMARHVNDLPDRLLLHIFSYLDSDDLEIAQEVCQHWHYLCTRPELWIQKCDELGARFDIHGISELLKEAQDERFIDWKLAFYELGHLLRHPNVIPGGSNFTPQTSSGSSVQTKNGQPFPAESKPRILPAAFECGWQQSPRVRIKLKPVEIVPLSSMYGQANHSIESGKLGHDRPVLLSGPAQSEPHNNAEAGRLDANQNQGYLVGESQVLMTTRMAVASSEQYRGGLTPLPSKALAVTRAQQTSGGLSFPSALDCLSVSVSPQAVKEKMEREHPAIAASTTADGRTNTALRFMQAAMLPSNLALTNRGASDEQPNATTGVLLETSIEALVKQKTVIHTNEVALDVRTRLKPAKNLLEENDKSSSDQRSDSPALQWDDPDSCNLKDPSVRIRCKGIVKEVRAVRRFQGHLDCINCVALDERRAFTGSADHLIFLWDLRSGRLVRRLSGHTGSIRCLQLDPDRNILYSGSWDESILVWDVVKFKVVCSLLGHKGVVSCLKLSEDRTMLVTASSDATVRMWSTITYSCNQELKCFGNSAILCLSLDGSHVTVGGVDGVVRTYNCHKEQVECKYFVELPSSLHEPYASHVPSAVSEMPVRSINSIMIINDLLLAGTSLGELCCWDRRSGQSVAVFQVHQSSVIAMSLCYGRLLTAGSDGLVKEWELGTLACVRVLRGHFSAIRAMEAREKDDRIVSVGDDKVVHVWDLRERKAHHNMAAKQELHTWLPSDKTAS